MAALERSLAEAIGGRSLHVLAPVLLLRGEPGVVALDGEADDPVLAEFRLQVVHFGLEFVQRRLALVIGLLVGFGGRLVVRFGVGLVVSPASSSSSASSSASA